MDFFVSYTAADRQWAEWIAWELEKAGFQCIVQAWDFRPGTDFIASMRDAMNRAQQTLVVLSPEYLNSKFAAAELNSALAKDPIGETSAVVPVRIVECDPPDMLRTRVYVDLAGLEEDTARTRLIEGIHASRAARSKPSEAVRFPRMPSFPTAAPAATAAPGPEQEASAVSGPVRLLFLASDCGVGLDLAGELDAIEKRLSAAKYGASFEVASRFDVRPEDFLPMLNRHPPHVFHFSGNFVGSSIALTSKDEGVRTIPFAGLVGLFRTAAKDMRLAVLNACESLPCAEALAEAFGCAIGVATQITDPAAIAFAEGFYGGLGAGKSVQEAFDSTLAAMRFAGVSSPDLPVIVARQGVDPSQILLCGGD